MINTLLIIALIPFIVHQLMMNVSKIIQLNVKISFHKMSFLILTLTLIFINFRYNLSFYNIVDLFANNRRIFEVILFVLFTSVSYYLYLIVQSSFKSQIISLKTSSDVKFRVFDIVVLLVLYTFSIFAFISLNWFRANFSFNSFEQLLFHANIEVVAKSNTSFLQSFLRNVSIPSMLLMMLFIIASVLLVRYRVSIFKSNNSNQKRLILDFKLKHLLLIYMTISLFFTVNQFYIDLKVNEYFYNLNNKSNFIEEYYVDPNTIQLTFPENKRNLIFIFLESMESTYFSTENGGYHDEELIPNILELSIANQSFSFDQSPSSLRSLRGTEWTIGGMVAQTAGIPLKVPLEGNSYGSSGSFLPGVTTIGDILGMKGYNQLLMIGSDADFGGRRAYFKTHGNYSIFEYQTAINKRLIPRNYFEWWGFEDEKLFEYAKDELIELAAKNEPFNFTMLTVNTHHIDGYLSDECEPMFDKQYASVIHCSDKMLGEFISWVQEQEFYDNTTIVLVGDHLSMDPSYFQNVNFERSLINIFINSTVETNNLNRHASVFDIFPTTLASLGVSIEGDRLGLGVNLFSDQPTLTEKYSVKVVNDELARFSDFYYNKFILNTINE